MMEILHHEEAKEKLDFRQSNENVARHDKHKLKWDSCDM